MEETARIRKLRASVLRARLKYLYILHALRVEQGNVEKAENIKRHIGEAQMVKAIRRRHGKDHSTGAAAGRSGTHAETGAGAGLLVERLRPIVGPQLVGTPRDPKATDATSPPVVGVLGMTRSL